MPLHVDRQDLPVLRLRYVGAYSDAEVIEFLRQVSAVVREVPGRKVCVIDLRKANAGSARQRQLQADWIGEHETLIERDFAAAAIVADNALIRGTVTAVFWLRPLPLPTTVTATIAQAEAWLAPYLAKL